MSVLYKSKMKSIILTGFFVVFGTFHLQVYSSCRKPFRASPQRAKEIFEQSLNNIKKGDIKVDFNNKGFEVKSSTLNPVNRVEFGNGDLHGETVFWKSIIDEFSKKELAVFLTLDQIGIQTSFKGVLENHGELLMISQFQKGDLIHLGAETLSGHPTSSNISSRTYQEFDKWKQIFLKYHIFPIDFQFLVSEDGAIHIIDVEMYEFLGGRSEELIDPLRMEIWIKDLVLLNRARGDDRQFLLEKVDEFLEKKGIVSIKEFIEFYFDVFTHPLNIFKSTPDKADFVFPPITRPLGAGGSLF